MKIEQIEIVDRINMSTRKKKRKCKGDVNIFGWIKRENGVIETMERAWEWRERDLVRVWLR